MSSQADKAARECAGLPPEGEVAPCQQCGQRVAVAEQSAHVCSESMKEAMAREQEDRTKGK
jgi:hypothetical protein